MPFTHKEIEATLTSLSGQAATLAEYRQATVAYQVNLSAEMASALGTPTRRLTPFLSTVIDVIANKLEIDNELLKAGRVKVGKEIQRWLGDNEWALIERELYQCVVRDGKAFILTTWTDDKPTFTTRDAYNGVSGAHVAELDGEPVYAFNAWSVEGAHYFDVYFPERIEKYIKSSDRDEWQPRTDTPDESWPISWTDDTGQPLGIAITAFVIDSSDIADAIQIARDMNETLLDMLASSRTQGWPQRWLKGQRNAGVLTNDLGQPVISGVTGHPIRRAVHAAPGSIMLLSDGSELDQLDPSKADPTVLDKLLELLSFVTTVPSHYFNGEWPSGVALIQAESRLNHKVEGHQGRLTSAIVTVLRLAMRLSNYFGNTDFDPEQPIIIPWHSPEIETEDLKQARQQFQTEYVTKLVGAGLMSKEIALHDLHPDWEEAQILEELARLNMAQPTGDTLNG